MARQTVQQVEALKPKAKPYKVTVDAGLRLRVAEDGVKRWTVRYTVNGKQREARLPKPWGPKTDDGHLSVKDARDEAARIRALARQGIDFQEQQEQQRQAEAERLAQERAAEAALAEQRRLDNLTVKDVFKAWLADGVRRKDGNAELQRSFDKNLLPAIGALPLKALTEHDLRRVLRSMVARGVNRAAVVLYQNLRQLLGWAEKRQPWRKLLSEGNPIDLIEIDKIVDPDYDLSNERKRKLTPEEIRELGAIFAAMRQQYDAADDRRAASRPVARTTEIAVWIMLSTLCRVGELTKARWEHVDLEKGEWFIPKENSKGILGKKVDFLVFLSPFALEQFRALHALTGESGWCFPARRREGHLNEKTISKQIGDRQILSKTDRHGKARTSMQHRSKNGDALVLAKGANGTWTPHDLRRTGASLMQQLKVDLATIDRCQNHLLPGPKTRRHYLLHDYAEEKREAWNRLGDYLQQQLHPAPNVVPLLRSA